MRTQFYSVVEVDEGMAFIHVDEAGGVCPLPH